MTSHSLTLGHSPDADDAFMFYALAQNKIATNGFTFEHILQDIQTLNERALCAELDITAISIHAYAYVLNDYAILRSGASMGDNYGPRLVAKKKMGKDELRNKRLAVPGKMTSAYLALQLYLETSGKDLDILFVPFDQIFEALHAGEAEVGLLIHEGQLTYDKEECHLIEDLGQWWFRRTEGLPLPLGANVIKKSLGQAAMEEISVILKQSISYSLEHRREALQHAMQYGRDLSVEEADEFVGMYVNDLTLDYGKRGEAGVREFLRQSHAFGFIPQPVALEFI